MNINLNFPNNIVFGVDSINELGSRVKDFGKRALIVTGKSSSKKSGALDKTIANLEKVKIEGFIFDEVVGEPDTDMVDKARDIIKSMKIDFVIGLGGGSALDVAKAAAGLYGQDKNTVEYLNKAPFEYKGMPFIGIPTTSGTGSEITLNSVLYNPLTKNKASLAHERFQSRLSIVDPKLTYFMSPYITAATGMDALTHAIESYTSKAANPVTKALAGESIRLIGKSIVDAVENGEAEEARTNMALGSLTAALAFAQTGVGVAHSISHPLGALYNIPHGVANAILLPFAIEFNYDSCPELYDDIGVFLGGKGNAQEQIREMLKYMPIPKTLEEAGYKKGNEEEFIERTFQSRSILKNPKFVREEDVLSILEEAF